MPPLSPPPPPFLYGIDVSEEQQDLPGAALVSVREEQVVARDAQGASARRVQRLSEDNILHVGRLNVLRKLHQSQNIKKNKKNKKIKTPSAPELLQSTSNHFLASLVRK